MKCITSSTEFDPLGHHQLKFCKFKHVVTCLQKGTHTHTCALIVLLTKLFISLVPFPRSPSRLPPLLCLPSSPSFFNPQLNERQRVVLARILGAQGRPAPYVVFGPPGTGKTMTVVEGILQVYSLSSGSCRILACAPSNSASDLIVRRERQRQKERDGKGETAKQAFVNCS